MVERGKRGGLGVGGGFKRSCPPSSERPDVTLLRIRVASWPCLETCDGIVTRLWRFTHVYLTQVK